MNLVYFTREAYKALRRDVESNEDKYYSTDLWLADYFSAQGMDEYVKTSTIVVPDVVLQYSGDSNESKNSDDLINTRLLYSGYKDRISPMQASDPLLWTALCHIKFHDYILKRWKNTEGNVTLSQRFFATEGRASLTYYNAISRLWWSGYLTYDEESANQWHLTETLFSAQQIQKDLTDQPFSMNPNVVKGLLMALKRMQEESGNTCTKQFRQCCDSYLNHYGAVTVLDSLNPEDIEEIAYQYMQVQM